MGRVHDMVTGLLNGSSSMMPLFFKSRGVGFAVEKTTPAQHGHSLAANNQQRKPVSKKKVALSRLSLEELSCQKLTFPVGLKVAVDGRRGDITVATGPVAQGGAAPLAGR